MVFSTSTASLVVTVCISAVAAWGAYLSIRSTQRGPVWARQHLATALIGGGVVAAAGMVAALLAEPVWMGIGVAYIGFVVAWLTWTVNRSLRRAAVLGLDEPLPRERRQAVLARSARALLGGAALIAVIAAFDYSVRGPIAAADLILAAAVAVPGLVAWRASSAAR